MGLNQNSASPLNTSGANPTTIVPTTSGSTDTSGVTSFEIAKISFYCLIFFSSTFGNGMVAYIICSTRKMRNASNYLILNLAVCDFLTPLISIPFDFALEENDYFWPFGGFMCRILGPAATLTTTSSALCLAVISLDRYRIIMHPYKPRLTPRQIAIFIPCTHVFSLACVIPYSYVLHLQDDRCQEGWGAYAYRQAYTAILFLVQYALPLVFMLIMYTLALIQLYHSYDRTFHMRLGASNGAIQRGKQEIGKLNSTPTKLEKSGEIKRPSRMQSFRSRALRRTSRANVRATKMFIVVVTVFAIFMLPNQVVWMWSDYGGGSNHQSFDKLVIICWLFTYTNCVCNPMIFTIFSNDFRDGFKRIFKPSYVKLKGSFSRSSYSSTFVSRTPRSLRFDTQGNDMTGSQVQNDPDVMPYVARNNATGTELWRFYKTTIYC